MKEVSSQGSVVGCLRIVVCVSLIFNFQFSIFNPAVAQTDWKKVEKLIDDGSYKSAYVQAEQVYKRTKNSNELLSAAWYMMKAGMLYQEDAADSATARFRAILPRLEAPERAVCYALLGEKDSALMDEAFLKRTPADRVKRFCTGIADGKGVNMTPTVFDVVVHALAAQNPEDAESLIERLIDFHQADGDDIRIFLDYYLLECGVSKMDNKGREKLYKSYINKYRASTCMLKTVFYSGLAKQLNNQGRHEEALRYCDTAIALAPKSAGGREALELKERILQTEIFFPRYSYDNGKAIPGRPSLHVLSYRNTGRLYMGIARYEEDENGRVKAPKVFRHWELDVDTSDKYNSRSILFDVPALEAGRWLLVVSADDKFDAQDAMQEIKCTDLKVIQTKNYHCFQLVNAISGEPIRGQEVKFYEKKRNVEQEVHKAFSDADGRVCCEDEEYGIERWMKIVRDGFEINYSFWRWRWNRVPEMEPETMHFQDRTVYRPGDTAQVAMMHYVTDGFNGHTVSDRKVTFVLHDPNYEERDSVQAVTDDFGVASARFVIPRDAMAGVWFVELEDDNYDFGHAESIMLLVEEYKQPKFMVSLDAGKANDDSPLQLGKPYTVQGLAQAYSGAKVDGAKVKYTITCSTRYWRRWGSLDYSKIEDSTVTAADGSFSITFTPQPDSSADLSQKPNFYFSILAEVTDLNGETHSAQTSVVVGYHNTTLKLASIDEKYVSSLESVAFSLQDINGRPLAGDVKLCVSRLHLPDTARLLPSVMNPNYMPHHTLSRERFHELFPTYAYSPEEYDQNKLKPDWEWSATEHIGADEVQHTVKLPRLQSGLYRVVASCGEERDTMYVTLTLPGEKQVQSNDLIWADIQPVKQSNPQAITPGDRIVLRYASAFDDVRFFYVVTGPTGEKFDYRWLPAGRSVRQLSILVDSTMLGGFGISLFAVKDGVSRTWSKEVDVPFVHKRLKMDIATFRDKLQPGEQEEWTINVTPFAPSGNASTRQSLASTIIMTMYDDALKNYGIGSTSFMMNPWRGYSSHNNSNWIQLSSPFVRHYYSKIKSYKSEELDISFWMVDLGQLNYRSVSRRLYDLNLKSTARGESNMVTMQGGVRKRTGVNTDNLELEEIAVISIGAPESGARLTAEDIAHMPGNSVDAVVAAVGGMGYSDGSYIPAPEPVQLRSNLSTLAFFVADLRTDDNGTATYRFRVPELLTRWRVEGIAVTKDLRIGTLDRTLVTQKSLMVQPNIPRFLRHGDSLQLMAKVVNLTDNERRVQIEFNLKDANGGDFLIRNHRIASVPAQGSLQVSFPIDRLPDDLVVATYEIVARTLDNDGVKASLSDGERGQIPVVSNRQAVTLSQPVYINGKGEKNFNFPISTFNTSSAEPHFLAAELVSNPLWLAVKAMPYLKQQENPSSLYLANSLYVNTLAKEIIGNFNIQFSISNLTDTANTRLKINEDVKQTLLEATPWLRDAEAETEQRQAIAAYFDSTRLDSEFRRLVSDLSHRQNDDGGWSWMPEGQSSLWVTMQILKRMSLFRQSVESAIKLALAYVDREEQRYYEKYIKPYLKKGYKWEPDNIDYLYTRSFYGQGKTDAYKFYYKNALKNYKNYTGLYTQAQLALIFQRHGDKKAASDLIRRIKEKSLENDEMGMYWRDNRSGWCWYERPIETQALLIQAFREVTPQDTLSIALMQQWLLKQKQTTHWGNDRATVEAINALITPENPNTLSNPNTLTALKSTTLTLCGVDLTAPSEGLEGYRSQRWEGPALDSIIRQEDSRVTLRKNTPGIAWGAVYYQYTDDMDKIPTSESGITLKRTFLNQNNQSVHEALKVGDRIKVRIEIACDRNMEYLELIDGRPSCVEPLSTRSGWCWSDGLSYYVEVKNTATHCYINRLEKGKYVVEYEVYVTNPGTFLSGPVTMQCMYAPEFRATAPAQRLSVD